MKNKMLVGVAVVIKSKRKRERWLIIKNSNNDSWEFPKIVVRKTESSVRAVIRMAGEQGGMRARVLEEAGRGTSSYVNSGRQIRQKLIYYLMINKGDSGESIGFDSPTWLEYSKAVRKLTSKKEQNVLRKAKKIYKEWEKKRKKRALLELQ